MIDPNTIGGLADRVGVSFALSVALLLFMSAAARWLMRSVFDRLINSHVSMIDHQKACNARNTESLQKLSEIEVTRTREYKRVQEEILTSNKQMRTLLSDLVLAIYDQTERLEGNLVPKENPDSRNSNGDEPYRKERESI